MEAVERNCHVTEYLRFKRRRVPIPVLPPRVPVCVEKKFGISRPNEAAARLLYEDDVAVQRQTNQNSIRAHKSPTQVANSAEAPSTSTTATSPSSDDNERKTQQTVAESVLKLYDPLDDAERQEKLTATSDASRCRSTNVASLDENAPPSSSHLVNGVANGGRTCNRPNSLNRGDDDADETPPHSNAFAIQQPACYDTSAYSCRPVPSFEKFSSSAVNSTRFAIEPMYMARKIDLDMLTNGGGGAVALDTRGTKFASSYCRSASERCPNDALLHSLDYRFRYGLSSLEICSKYASRSRSTDNGFAAKREKYAAYSDRITYQASTAAAFFARASQKLKLNSSPHRRRRRGSGAEDGASAGTKNIGGFSNLLHRSPPPVPSALLRKIGQKEATGIGKVKVMLKVCVDSSSTGEDAISPVFSMDKKRKQITLYEPVNSNAHNDTPEERKCAVSAPKMFAFDALFSDDDPLVEICGNALTDVIHAVINGNDGCIFCFGNAKLGKTKTMIGSSESAATLGVIPCAITWLYRAVNEQKQKTGARFSVRVSAVEITAASQQIKDLLTDYASDNEQSPGVYLKDDPVLGSNLQNRSELRAPLPEKAAFYLDAAQNERSTSEESHFLFTLHVYQYNVANKGTVAGGRSRLYLIDLAGNDRSKSTGSLSVSNLGNVLLAIFNGQKHLPSRDHKITQVLKECLSSLTCHAAMIAHVSPSVQHYHETLATVQMASRIHRIRRRKIKFIGVSNGINTTVDENGRLTSSSDFDPSSSEQSADTVIYVGPSDETDGEHPPVHIPNLNSADNRGLISKVLRESAESGEFLRSSSKIPQISKSVPASPQKLAKTETTKTALNLASRKHHLKAGFHSAHSSPVRTPKTSCEPVKLSEERWIDGPRISKSKIAEARNVHMMKKEGQKSSSWSKKETWVDGPMKKPVTEPAYGFMDSHKKNMIRKWVENQSYQMQYRSMKCPSGETEQQNIPQYKSLTVFKTCDNAEEAVDMDCRGQGSGQEEDDSEEPIINGHISEETYCKRAYLIENHQRIETRCDENDQEDEDIEIEIIEVEEPEEPVPMQDSCLQVTEEDIALCMGSLENPLPEVDQEEHPLRVLSQENMTVVSTFTDSMSVANDLDRIFPRSRWYLNHNSVQQKYSSIRDNIKFNEKETKSALSRLDESHHENKFNMNSCFSKHLNGTDTLRAVSRCQSLIFSELCNPAENNLRNTNDFENSSIASEPAYLANVTGNDRLCENCKVSLTSIQYDSQRNTYWSHQDDLSLGKLQSYRHMKNIMNLRHPDGASNPNLQEMEGNSKLTNGNGKTTAENDSEEEDESAVPLPLTSKLLTLSREGLENRLFTKHCDSSEFTNGTVDQRFCNGIKKNDLFSHKGQFSKANVKKLQTYRVELKNKK
ncbi:kinesin-like protein CG14535 [Planococcus citri]|uniref:kinesin-like protein CG14535 n=1 Tax=Planococcus citri TaxID=170843 RepID=UPI0031F9FDCB